MKETEMMEKVRKRRNVQLLLTGLTALMIRISLVKFLKKVAKYSSSS